MPDSLRRGIRTFLQFVAGGGLTVLVDNLVVDIPDQYDFYVVFAAGALVSLSQNWLEDNTAFPAVLKASASTGQNPVTHDPAV